MISKLDFLFHRNFLVVDQSGRELFLGVDAQAHKTWQRVRSIAGPQVPINCCLDLGEPDRLGRPSNDPQYLGVTGGQEDLFATLVGVAVCDTGALDLHDLVDSNKRARLAR